MNIRNTLFLTLLFALPLLVAAFDVSFLMTLSTVLILVVARWLYSFRQLAGGHSGPTLILETIGASHYAEKVRWVLDRLGQPYTERVCAGTLGAFYWGRTVPVLEFRTGRAWSRIGNSREILRYLWGASDGSAEFLRPTPERDAFEARLDRYGQNLQVWLYWHMLDDKELMLEAWGARDRAVPLWQRYAIRLLYPVQRRLMRRTFRLSPEHYASARGHIEKLLQEVETALGESASSILGEEGADLNYTDLAFAALSTPWVLPSNFADRGRPVLEFDSLPEAMRADIETFRATNPRAYEFALRLYDEERAHNGEGT